MTKTEAKQVAAHARQYGHFEHGTTLWLVCPRCRQRVETERNYCWVPVRKGQPYSQVVDGKRCIYEQETVKQALDRAMVDHLLYDCA